MLWRAPTRDDAEEGHLGVVMKTDPPSGRIGTRKAAVLEPIAEELQQWLTAEGP